MTALDSLAVTKKLHKHKKIVGAFGSISPNCDESTWPDKDHGLVCGECKVLVDNMDDKYGTCTAYCNAVGRKCVSAWEESQDSCTIVSTEDCSHNFDYTDDAICECGDNLGRLLPAS